MFTQLNTEQTSYYSVMASPLAPDEAREAQMRQTLATAQQNYDNYKSQSYDVLANAYSLAEQEFNAAQAKVNA